MIAKPMKAILHALSYGGIEVDAKRLMDAGNEVEMHRIPDALHGFFAFGIQFLHVQESFAYINQFLGKTS